MAPKKSTAKAANAATDTVPENIKAKADAQAEKAAKSKGGRKIHYPAATVITVLNKDTKIKPDTVRHAIFDAIVAKDGQTVAQARERCDATIGAWDFENAVKCGNITVAKPEPAPKAEPKPKADKAAKAK